MPRIPFGDWVNTGVNWLLDNAAWLFDFFKAVFEGCYDGILAVLDAPQPLLLAGIFAVCAWWLRGLFAGVLSFVGFAFIDSLQLWEHAMMTLSLVLVATILALVIAVPIGIWAAYSERVGATVRPVLDLMQTMPAMIYLIPAILFFGSGAPAGIVATLIFALAPGVRLTELGIRQVDRELVEAAEAFGTQPRKILLRVQFPLALPTVMTGVNQVIMLSLSMAAIAGMVGAEGLGGDVNEAIGQLNVGLGAEAGIAIVLLAIYLDRMTGALGTQVSPLGRRLTARRGAAVTGFGSQLWNHRPRPAFAGSASSSSRSSPAAWVSSAAPRSPRSRASATARRSPSATSPGTRPPPPPTCGRRPWSGAATRCRSSSSSSARCGPRCPAATWTSRRTPRFPSPTRRTGRSTARTSSPWAPGTRARWRTSWPCPRT